jgi:transposase
VVGYNVQAAVETDHHLIVAHDVVQTGSDRAQLVAMAQKAKQALGVEELRILVMFDFSSAALPLSNKALSQASLLQCRSIANCVADRLTGIDAFHHL